MERLSIESNIVSPFRRYAFWVTALLASLGVLLVHFAAPEAFELLAIGAGLSVLLGLTAASALNAHEAQRTQAKLLAGLVTPLHLAAEQSFLERYQRFSRAITELSGATDSLLRGFALLKLDVLCAEVEELAQGKIVFPATETWRTAYRDLLESLSVKSYYSVSWVRSGEYWNDAPGRQGLQLNYELLKRGFHIERVLILTDELWPFEEPMPTAEIRYWIEQQHLSGIWVSLVRECDLAGEPELLVDFGIYGDRAVGVQELDERCRTIRYLLLFDDQSRRQAHDRWERLALFATPFSEILDRTSATR